MRTGENENHIAVWLHFAQTASEMKTLETGAQQMKWPTEQSSQAVCTKQAI